MSYSTIATCAIHGKYESKLVSVLDREIKTSCPHCFDIAVEKKNEARANEMYSALRAADLASIVLRSGVLKRFSDATLSGFETPTDNHRAALDAATQYLERIVAGGEDKLILCGTTGTGKTHLGCAIALAFIDRTGRDACYTKASRLCDRIHDEMFRNHSSITAEIPKIIGNGLLVLDEVGAYGSDKPFQISVLSEAIDYCINNELPIMLMSNLDHESLSAAIGGDRSIDRMNEGNVVSVYMAYGSYRGSK